MQDFAWNFPTKLVYGPGKLAEVGQVAQGLGKKAFLATYEANDTFAPIIDKVVTSLAAAGVEVVTFTEIEPNPRAHTIDKAIELFNAEGCDLVIALGGGSVIDGSKYIAATSYSGGSCWDYVVLGDRTPREYTGAFPIISIPTVAASGSECNAGGVLTNWETKEKSFSRSEYRIPKVAILDPELHASLPDFITAESCIDIFSHLIEHYLSSDADSGFADRMTEGMILNLMDNFDKIIENPQDLEVRGQLALCSIFGWSGFQALGRLGSIPMHSIEMPLSAHYDMRHARGMAVVIPPYLEYFADVRPDRWAQLARRCFGVVEQDNDMAAKLLAVKVTEWLKRTGMYIKLSDDGISDEKFEEMADDVIRMFALPGTKTIAGVKPITKEEIIEVFKLAH
ncbi:iron-containing alcohol dehydrogenase [Photobacterium sanguinicancri]|uniref:iron-containing alcohol dehydrogenase n=1 Tax=Photobacterium sanguinicancri TaxID=875932 RepID=UPI000788A569|nr:iron-containing alcohol dehydrogenase [Photobacterium sanguinicancri]KXI21076.1 alcohol dehydrogenase [Photobacterium sanguinicancri]